jgi:uncharacterized membrane protein
MFRIRQTLVLAVLLLAPLAVSGQAQAQDPSATVRGRIISTDGQPIAGARVRLGEANATVTSAAGRYTLSATPGFYRLRVEGLGYEPSVREVRIAAGEARVVDVSLSPSPVQLEGVSVVSVTRSSLPVAATPGAVPSRALPCWT